MRALLLTRRRPRFGQRKSWSPRLDERIAELERLRDDLDSCIGCGCLSLQRCNLYNKEDRLSTRGPGARLLNGAYYIVGATPAYRSATAIFTVPGLAASSVRVFGEGRTVPVRNGRFTDAFAGLGVHIYIAAPPGL